MKGIMTDITKYRNVSLTHDTYKKLIELSKVLLPDAKLSISKTIESIAKSTVHQCWDCDSEGEFYEIDDMGFIDDGTSDSLH